VLSPTTYEYKDGDVEKKGFKCPWPGQRGFSSVIFFILALTLIFRVTIGLDFVELARPIKHLPAVTTFKILQHNRKLQDGSQKLA
jgi:hypothetical protein